MGKYILLYHDTRDVYKQIYSSKRQALKQAAELDLGYGFIVIGVFELKHNLYKITHGRVAQ